MAEGEVRIQIKTLPDGPEFEARIYSTDPYGSQDYSTTGETWEHLVDAIRGDIEIVCRNLAQIRDKEAVG